MSERRNALLHLIETVKRLRDPGGCPWDREQTHQSLRPYLLEETHEVLEVLDRVDSAETLKDPAIRDAFREELGDLLMQVLIHAQMASEVGAFDFIDVARTLDEKLVRRHPHVFGDEKANTADEAFKNWEKRKTIEKVAKKKDASCLDGVPQALPALLRAQRVIEKVTKVGFQWQDMKGPLAKVDEELSELKAEILKPGGANQTKLEAELGDVLFTLANVAYLQGIQPEDALRTTLERFGRRFRHVEKKLREQGRTPEQSTLEEMDRFWGEAKNLEEGQS